MVRMRTVFEMMTFWFLVVVAGSAWAGDSYRIGGVLPFSGTLGFLGEDAKRGVTLAVEERGGKVLGRNIELVWEDSEGKPPVAVQKTSKLLASGLDLLVGAANSSETLALMSLPVQYKVPHLSTISADDRITGTGKTRYTFRTSSTWSAEILMADEYAKAAELQKVYGVVADVGTARDGWEVQKQRMARRGVVVTGEDFPSLGSKDFTVIINKAVQSGADSICLTLFGNDSVIFLKQAAEVGLGSRLKIFGPVILDEISAKAVGEGSVGVLSAVRQHFSLDNAANRRFTDLYRKKYGDWPGWAAGEAYDAVAWWLDVVEKTGGTDKEKWIDAFEKSTRTNSLKGTKTMRACDHQAEQVGLWAVCTKGEAPLPAYTMKVTNVFPVSALYEPCR
ncbi:MAG: ABC transporter substrate-binding protein [Deferrisomatales bacterium]